MTKGDGANIHTGMFYYDLVQERRAEPQDDLFSRLIAAEIDRDNGEKPTA